jgi:hypothetical protein
MLPPASSPNFYVGGNGRHRQAGTDGDDFGHQNYQYRPSQPGIAHYPAQAQVHNYAQNCQHIGRKYPAKGPKFLDLGVTFTRIVVWVGR